MAQQLIGFKESSDPTISMIVGPMFAGKTTELMRQVHRHMHAGKSAIIVRSLYDTRYDVDKGLRSHDGVIGRAAVVTGRTLKCDVVQEAVAGMDVVGIDEGQFFEDVIDACEDWVAAGKHVIVAGLDGNANGHPFGHMCELLARAEKCIKLLAVCTRCKNDAPFTILLRGHLDDDSIRVGGAETCAPVCRKCRDAAVARGKTGT